jgi:hypothetical protein
LLFDKVGFNNVWENQNSFGRNRLTYAMYKQLRNYFIKFWEESILKNITEKKGNKLRTYKDLKKKFEMENLLKLDIDRSDISNL